MRVLVCGSRDWDDREIIHEWLEALVVMSTDPVELIQGGARGADAQAIIAARDLGVPYRTFTANWTEHGRAAGPIRNRAMLDENPTVVLAFQRDGSRGTQDTIDEARRRGIPVKVCAA